jgi:hypothetical protein
MLYIIIWYIISFTLLNVRNAYNINGMSWKQFWTDISFFFLFRFIAKILPIILEIKKKTKLIIIIGYFLYKNQYRNLEIACNYTYKQRHFAFIVRQLIVSVLFQFIPFSGEKRMSGIGSKRINGTHPLCPFVSGPVFVFIWAGSHSKSIIWGEKISCCGLQFDISTTFYLMTINPTHMSIRYIPMSRESKTPQSSPHLLRI